MSTKVNCPAENIAQNKKLKKSVSAKKLVKTLKAFRAQKVKKRKAFVQPKRFCKLKGFAILAFQKKACQKIKNSSRVKSSDKKMN